MSPRVVFVVINGFAGGIGTPSKMADSTGAWRREQRKFWWRIQMGRNGNQSMQLFSCRISLTKFPFWPENFVFVFYKKSIEFVYCRIKMFFTYVALPWTSNKRWLINPKLEVTIFTDFHCYNVSFPFFETKGNLTAK